MYTLYTLYLILLYVRRGGSNLQDVEEGDEEGSGEYINLSDLRSTYPHHTSPHTLSSILTPHPPLSSTLQQPPAPTQPTYIQYYASICIRNILYIHKLILRACLPYQSTVDNGDTLTASSILFISICSIIICLAGNMNNLASLVSVIFLTVYTCINALCTCLVLLKGSRFIKASRFHG